MSLNIRIPTVLQQFTVFVGVGSINTVAALLLILFLSEIIGMQYLLANFLGYIFGLCIGFVLHKRITFRDKSPEFYKQFRAFVAVFCVAYLVQLVCLFLMVDYLGFYTAPAQILSCGVYTVINYTGNKFGTFRSGEKR